MTLLSTALLFFTDEPEPAPSGPYHSFVMNVGNRGYNAVLGRGSITSGSAGYSTPAGTAVTVIHCRAVGSNINFSLGAGTSYAASEFPSRIVATKTTGGEVELEFTPTGNPFAISGGTRLNYAPTSGSVGDVFVNGQTVKIDLYYEPVEVAGVANLTFPSASIMRSLLTDANGITSIQEVEFVRPGGSVIRPNPPTRQSANSFLAELTLSGFGTFRVNWTYTDGLGSGKTATATATRSL